MAHAKFRVEVLTPVGEVFNDEVEQLSTRTLLGEIGILARHTPVLGVLEPTELRLYRTETEIVRFAQSEGYLQVADNHAMLLVEDAVAPESLDVRVLREKLAESESEIESASEDSARRAFAQRHKRRYEAFIKVAEGG